MGTEERRLATQLGILNTALPTVADDSVSRLSYPVNLVMMAKWLSIQTALGTVPQCIRSLVSQWRRSMANVLLVLCRRLSLPVSPPGATQNGFGSVPIYVYVIRLSMLPLNGQSVFGDLARKVKIYHRGGSVL